ncbi:MerR family transcriptional regulator [Rothia nasimurium]|uniref:transcriptional regulator FtsR n=1 Tax=Rothia nasimurium TaxID=85336 RepID=UPI001F1C8188|nr:MerR family transcriptional regulator [Rothia nasimurium]
MAQAHSAETAGAKNKTIGQVLSALEGEFEGISASKIRFLEDKGLVSPQRTNTGYRKYSEEDIERLRFVLQLQRDQYLPLKVIRQRLADIDAGLAPAPGSESAEVQGSGADASAQPGAEELPSARPAAETEPARTYTLRELGQEAGVDMPLLRELMNYGLLADNKEEYDQYDLAVTRVSDQLTAHGLHPRHLRAFRAAADREVDLVETAVGPLALRKDEESQARAAELAGDIAQLLLRLHMALVAGSMPSYD